LFFFYVVRAFYNRVNLLGEASWRQERAVHDPAAVGLPAAPVQAGPAPRPPARGPHPDQARHHLRPLAVHQDPQAAGRSREGVRQLRRLPQADIPGGQDEICGDSAAPEPAAPSPGSDCD